MSGGAQALALATALGAGLGAGVFFTFSAFVLAALDRLPAARAVAAMQSIDVTAVRPPLMVALFGTALACLALLAVVAADWGEGSAWALAGAVTYLAGAVGVTMACNVPRNNRLAAVDPEAPEAGAEWKRYRAEWGAWNHLRAAASLLASALLIAALLPC